MLRVGCFSGSLHSARHRRPSWLCGLLLLLPCLLLFPISGRADDSNDELSQDVINQLIGQLDSRLYSERELATRRLTDAGQNALGPLAFRLLDGTPESAWRIKKIIEQIGTRGNADTYLKAMGILEIFVGPTPELFELEQKWKAEQERLAIQALTDAGATVDVPRRNIQQNRFGQLRAWPNRPDTSTTAADRIKSPPPAVNLQSARRKIKSILANSSAANEKLIFGNRDRENESPAGTDSPFDPVVVNQMGMQPGIVIINGRAFTPPTIARAGVSVEFGPEWNVDESDFETLAMITRLDKVAFRGHQLTNLDLSAIIANRSIRSLELADCQLSTTLLETILDDSAILSLTFSEQRIPRSYISRIADAGKIRQLEFENCSISPAAFEAMGEIDSLVSLRMSEVALDEEFFDSVSGLKGLRSLSLSACDYDATRVRQLVSARPDINLSFPPQAFLGVRGFQAAFQAPDVQGCVITEVIPGSGAERGGIQVNDIVRKVDGEPIADFDELRQKISRYRNGNVLLIQIERDGKTSTLKVKLGHIDDAPQN